MGGKRWLGGWVGGWVGVKNLSCGFFVNQQHLEDTGEQETGQTEVGGWVGGWE